MVLFKMGPTTTIAAAACLLSLTSPVPVFSQAPLAVGDYVCVEGFVMDIFCIDRGTLLDNPSVVSLVNPEKHSYHCVFDVPQCVDSGYEVLVEPAATAGATFSRGLRLDGIGNTKAIAFGRETGEKGLCTTCSSTASGSPTVGFRATINGTVSNLGDASTPLTIATESVVDSSVGCGEYVFNPPFVITAAGGQTSRIFAHGSLMIISWGWLLPSGVLIAKFFKHRPDGLWFKIHRVLQILGLLLAFSGWIIALVTFDVFGSPGTASYAHGILGCTVMSIGLQQPINAFVRPHAAPDGQPKPTSRLVWELAHRGLGWTAVFLAVATISLGTTLVPMPSDQIKFQYGYGLGAGLALTILLVGILKDKSSFSPVSTGPDMANKV